jgi:hypothetical protein
MKVGMPMKLLKISVYGWMFYLPQVITLSMIGGLAGISGLLAVFFTASIGYTLRALIMMGISVGIMCVIFHKKPSLDVFNYFLPLSGWGVLSLLLRVINWMVPQILQIRIIVEQVSLIMAWFFSYYKLGALFKTEKNSTMWPIVVAVLIAILVFFLLPPPI